MDNEEKARKLFSEYANERIAFIDEANASSLEDLLRIQAAHDQSHKLHAVLDLWANQRSEERKLRKLYALCFVIIMAIQIIIMNIVYILVGIGMIELTESQFSVFFISVFGEITAFVIIVTKYLFSQDVDSKIIDALKEL